MEFLHYIYILIFPVICFIVAKEKGRSPWGWALAGLFFQFIALIIVAVASDLQKEAKIRQQVGELSQELTSTKMKLATRIDDSGEKICEKCRQLSALNVCRKFTVEIQDTIVECDHFEDRAS